jgi:hypothetical protein
MDASYERNITTLLTTITSNIITITLLSVYQSFKEDSINQRLTKENGVIAPSLWTYLQAFSMLLTYPLRHIRDATVALCGLICNSTLGLPYKYTRLLSDAQYFIGYNSEDEMNEDRQDRFEENCSRHIDDDQLDSDGTSVSNPIQIDIRKSETDDTRLPKIWLPKYWPKNVKEEKGIYLFTLPDKSYISDPIFDGMYSIKSFLGCLFGIVQCISTIILSCIRLQNIDTVHTMDVLSMYTSYILLCTVISISFNPSYYCKPVVCIPRNELEKYTNISNESSFSNLHLHILVLFGRARGHILIRFLLLTPICLMVALLIYINRNSALLLSLCTLWMLATTLISLLSISEGLLYIFYPIYITVTLGLLITMSVCSCLYATPEQKYPSSVNWLPHF